MEDTINSKDYWNIRFKGDWQEAEGVEQTEFFGNIICEFLPQWLTEQIKENHFNICDMGCALGGAVKIISEQLKCKVQGYDFSEEAIKIARELYPDYEFNVLDLNYIPEEFNCDISICSNVLEHFEDPWNIVNNLMKVTNKYVILLCPYQEKLEVDEHVYYFSDEVIPVRISGYNLVHKSVIDAEDKTPTYYPGMEILLIYAKMVQLRSA